MSPLITILEKLGRVKSPKASPESVQVLLSNNCQNSMWRITNSYLPQGMTKYPCIGGWVGPRVSPDSAKILAPSRFGGKDNS
jgi:hypothetical protein